MGIKKMNGKYAIITLILALATIGTANMAYAQIPTVSLSETEMSPNDVVYVYGQEFAPNSTVRIDLYLPSGQTIEGVSYNITDANGSFTSSFVVPDSPSGYGYVKVVSDNITVSVYVHFIGSEHYEMSVLFPDKVYINEKTNITVEAPFVSGNHILDVTYYRPDGSILKEFKVLNEGYCTFTTVFYQQGTYQIDLSIRYLFLHHA
jgi:hypothetical protein